MMAFPVPVLENAARSAFHPNDLTESAAERVERAAHRIRALGQILQNQAETTAVEIGRVLIGVKPILGHGQFTHWLEAEFGWSDRTARNLMAAARLADEKSEIVSVLPPTGLYKLASDSTPETCVTEVIGRLEAGERFSAKEIGRIVTDARKRESREKVTARKLERRLAGKTGPQKRRVLAADEARRRQLDREEERNRERQNAQDAALAEAVGMLRDRLGPDLRRFAALVEAGNPWNLLTALKAASTDGDAA